MGGHIASIERRDSCVRGATRFFIGLLGSAYISIPWVGLTDWGLWFALPICFAMDGHHYAFWLVGLLFL